MKICFDRGRTRTCNPQIRSLVPYPLGHTAQLGGDRESRMTQLCSEASHVATLERRPASRYNVGSVRNQKSKLRLAQLELDRKFNSKNFWFSSIWYPIYGKIFLEKVAIIARLFPRAKGDIPGAIAVSVSVSPPGPCFP